MPLQPNAQLFPDLKISVDVIPELLRDDESRSALTLSSIVEEVFDDETFLIHMPIHQGYHYPLPLNEPLNIRFFYRSDLYGLQTECIGRIDLDGFRYARMLRLGPLVVYHPRDCYRLPLALPITIKRWWEDEDAIPGVAEATGKSLNFSDGGMLFVTNDPFKLHEHVSLTFTLNLPETVGGTVVRLDAMDTSRFQSKVAVQFRDGNQLQKHRFYKFIVDKQLEQRRKWTAKNEPM